MYRDCAGTLEELYKDWHSMGIYRDFTGILLGSSKDFIGSDGDCIGILYGFRMDSTGVCRDFIGYSMVEEPMGTCN